MSWFATVPVVLTGLLLVIAPGAPVAFALGARGITFLALSVGSSVSTIAISSIAVSMLGIGWSPLAPFIVSIPVAAACLLLRRLWSRRRPLVIGSDPWGWAFLAALLAIGISAVLIALPVKAGIGMPDWPSQTYDAIFHLNAVQHVLQTADASPFQMTVSTPDRTSGFYPTVWHAIAAFTVQITGASIPVAANALSFVIGCFIWPLSCVFLARQIFGQRPLALLLAGVLSAGFAAFPLLLIEFGVLYPNLLAVSLLPLALGCLVGAVGLARNPGLETPGRWLMLLWVVGGSGLAHPSAFFAMLLLGLPVAVQGSIRYLLRSAPHTTERVKALGYLGLLVVATALGVLIWLNNGTGDNAWQPYQTVPQAVGEALLNGPILNASALVVSALAFIGIVRSFIQTRYLWITVSYGLSVFLFVVASAWPDGELRTSLTGLWYNDYARLAAMLPLLAVPLATLGGLVVVGALRRLTTSAVRAIPSVTVRSRIVGLVTVVALVAVVPLTQDQTIAAEQQRMAGKYALSSESPLLTPDEIAIFDIVRSETPADAVIGGNPWNGSALVYAYTGRKALFPHVGGAYDDERLIIGRDFADSADTMCAAVNDKHMTYVLDFGDRYLFGDDPRSRGYAGFDNLTDSDAVTLVAEQGAARLYRVDACS